VDPDGALLTGIRDSSRAGKKQTGRQQLQASPVNNTNISSTVVTRLVGWLELNGAFNTI